MSYINPETQLILFSVPWGNNDNNFLKFDNREKQTSAFLDYYPTVAHLEFSKYNIVNNDSVRINVNKFSALNYNYIMFKNPDTGAEKWYYAYIDSVEWLSYNSCLINFSLDAWQCYQFNIIYKKSFVERSHIAKNDDIVGKWLAGEPINVEAMVVKDIESFDSLSWSPKWVLHATSWYNTATKKYIYSGLSSDGIITGEVGLNVNSVNDLNNLIKNYGRKSPDEIVEDVGSNVNWQDILSTFLSGGTSISSYNAILGLSSTFSAAELQDHRNELIGLYAVPEWVKGGATSSKFVSVTNHSELIDVNINQNSLPCGYTPRNKKMLTSLCRGFCLYTGNGFRKTFKPELIGPTASFKLIGNAMSIDKIICDFYNYQNESDRVCTIPYNYQTRFGYDANTGLDKIIGSVQSSIGLIGNTASIASGNPLGILYGTSNALSSVNNIIDSIGQRGISNGTTGDLLTISSGYAIPHFADISVTKKQAEYIDDFLDVYGYSINEIMQINIDSRSSWNYIKVSKLNAQIKAPDEYANVIKDAFKNGVHIWHTSINNVGNFGLSNN